MDALSRLLELARVSGVVDFRCQLGGGFDVVHDPLPPNEAAFHLVVSGEGRLVMPDQPALDMKAGDLVVLFRDGGHRVQQQRSGKPLSPVVVVTGGPFIIKTNTDEAPDLDLLCGRFVSSSAQAKMLFDSLPPVLHVRLSDEHTIASMAGLVDILRSEVAHMDVGAHLIVAALTQALFVLVLRWAKKNGPLPKSLLAVMSEPRLARAMARVLENPAGKWTVESLAVHASMSRATFARHFEATAGLSPLEVVTHLRMDMAGELLRTTTRSVGAIGEAVGYQSESAFSRAFHKASGYSPARYRRSLERSELRRTTAE